MEEVEGIDVENIENWVSKVRIEALTYTVVTGLTPTVQYRFRIRAVNEYEKQSIYSEVATFYAAALPERIAFDSVIFTGTDLTKLTLEWLKPVLSAEQLPILSYKIYWDAGYLL